jgi:diaminopimelate epimerase
MQKDIHIIGPEGPDGENAPNTRPFLKMNGAGNDFVIFDSRHDGWMPTVADIQLAGHRRFGIGADQLVVLTKSDVADVYMTIFNTDGFEAPTCGNAIRSIANLLQNELGLAKVSIETKSGMKYGWLTPQGTAVDIGAPDFDWQKVPLAYECDTMAVNEISLGDLSAPTCLSMGNPHAVFFVADVDALDLADIGPKLVGHKMFPEHCNVSFAQVINRTHVKMRTFERGAGETLACGTGAGGVVASGALKGLLEREKIQVDMPGGTLHLMWRDDDHLILSGPVAKPFGGEIALPSLNEGRADD